MITPPCCAWQPARAAGRTEARRSRRILWCRAILLAGSLYWESGRLRCPCRCALERPGLRKEVPLEDTGGGLAAAAACDLGRFGVCRKFYTHENTALLAAHVVDWRPLEFRRARSASGIPGALQSSTTSNKWTKRCGSVGQSRWPRGGFAAQGRQTKGKLRSAAGLSGRLRCKAPMVK